MESIIINHSDIDMLNKYVQDNHCWCELTPLPDMMWEATFKNEGHVEKLSMILDGHVTPV